MHINFTEDIQRQKKKRKRKKKYFKFNIIAAEHFQLHYLNVKDAKL